MGGEGNRGEVPGGLPDEFRSELASAYQFRYILAAPYNGYDLQRG